VRTDRGGEYLNRSLNEYFSSKGVLHQMTAPYTPQQNGAAERLNRTLMERVRAMVLGAGLGQELWAEAVVTANYIRNRSPVSNGSKTPWEQLFSKQPDVSTMRVFGARAYVLTPRELRRKLDPVSQPGVFVGYSAHSKAYRVLLDSNNKVVESRDVVVDETARLGRGVSVVRGAVGLDSDDDDEEQLSARPSAAPSQQPGVQDSEGAEAEGSASQPLSRTVSEEGAERGQKQRRARAEDMSVPEARYPQRQRQGPGQWYVAHLAEAAAEPATVEQALAGPDAELWRRAMDEEMASLAEHQTW
jgi:hypothetical protein